jgi:hypothetical protein
VVCWFAATNIIIVHAWKIIMNKRISVYALNGACGGHSMIYLSSAGLGCSEAQNWS